MVSLADPYGRNFYFLDRCQSGLQYLSVSIYINIYVLLYLTHKVRYIQGSCQSRYVALATNPEARVRFPALPDILRNSGSRAVSTQPLRDPLR
jgi:hypothetical protein